MNTASSLGFRAAALTFLNRPAVVAVTFSGLTQMWASTAETEEAGLQFRERWRGLRESPTRPNDPVPVGDDRRYLPISRQRALPGAAPARRASSRRDAGGRP